MSSPSDHYNIFQWVKSKDFRLFVSIPNSGKMFCFMWQKTTHTHSVIDLAEKRPTFVYLHFRPKSYAALNTQNGDEMTLPNLCFSLSSFITNLGRGSE